VRHYTCSNPTFIMDPNPTTDPLPEALARYGLARPDIDLSGFDRGVWNRIAALTPRREQSLSGTRIFAGALAGACVGVILAWVGANLYGDQQRGKIEQRYVETIHPVWRSNHLHDDAAL